MWRYFSRGFNNQGLKRSLCFDKTDTHLKDGKSSQQRCCIKELLPCALQKLNLSKCKDGKQKYGEGKKGPENVGHHSFFEAFGWSGALVFGWVISKQIWLRHGWTQDQDTRPTRIVSDQNFISFLSHIGLVNTQPPASFVLPVPVSPSKSKKSDIPDVDDEFDKAAEELLVVHKKAIAEALNRRGISCLSKATGSEAMKYFRRASELKYPPASFNMGQCCELGIGTKQDFKQAAEWYKIAADQGHPTATYNLGVFYAHGWGGLNADIDTARRLFTKAAQLGQPDAIAALERESKNDMRYITKANDSSLDRINSHETKSSNLNYFADNIRNGLGDGIFMQGYDSKWEVPLTSTLPVAI
ncbi:uncharacterized protein LOC128999815 isoform X1 [Macrosteles quadrilineatus]|uniref:uncharacterized protein LOC128999815 isoform X1 n=1 Tax=Macrosteles quadrilineatus TaxID=74068 RepID=UPI0023E3395A|nr:uncharacterized protein LOC128999815 isoform X1 [Macrosteles quadrilineatus]